MNKQKSLETIGNALQQQYEKWQNKAGVSLFILIACEHCYFLGQV